MLTNGDVKIIREIVQEVVNKEITTAITKAVAPLVTKTDAMQFATKADVAKLDTRITKLDVKMSSQFSELKNKTTKDTDRLEKAIKREHKIGGEILQVAQVENRETVFRVERIERQLGLVQI